MRLTEDPPRYSVEIEKSKKWSLTAWMPSEQEALKVLEATVKARPNLRVRVTDPKNEIIALDAMGTIP